MTTWLPNLAHREGPIYQAIADAIEEAVAEGRLSPGMRLPTQRSLARKLEVTVGTISRAYQEAERRGLLLGEVGRGTFVREPEETEDGWMSAVDGTGTDAINLSVNFPPAVEGEDELLSDTLTELAHREGVHRLLHYQPATSTPRQRRAGRRWLSSLGLDVSEEQVLVAAGGQHALTAVFAAVTRPGDLILADTLTYPGLRTIARMFSLEVQGVESDDEGLDPARLERACAERDVRALYCLPTLQNPTVATLSPERRRQIAEVCSVHEVFIVEDDTYAPLLPGAPAPVTSYAPGRSCYISSLSKAVAPGLRVAFLAVSESHRARIDAGVRATLWMPPPLMVEIACRWIESGRGEELLEARRTALRRRSRLAETILSGFSRRAHELSLHSWLELPDPWTSREFAAAAEERGVLVTEADHFCVDERAIPRAVRVCLGAPTTDESLVQGLTTLRDLLDEGPPPYLTKV